MSIAAQRGLVAGLVWAIYTALIALANLLAAWSGGDDTSPWMMASGVTMGFVAVPVFSIILPIWLARRWGLAVSWWPRRTDWPLALALILGFVMVASFGGLGAVLGPGGPWLAGFGIHFTSAALFHVTYYPLFVILLLGAWRPLVGLVPAMALTALAFAAYHFAQFHFFPKGTTAPYFALLFVTFMVSQLFYLITRSLMLAALAHCVNGAVELARAGTLFDQMDFLFWLDVVLLTGLVAWSFIEARRNGPADARFWLRIAPADG